MPVETVSFLRQVSALSLLDDAELARLAEKVQVVHHGIGQIICRAGDPGDSLYIVFSGRARVIAATPDGETTVGTLSRGDHFGEQALLNGGRRAFTVRAAEDLVLQQVPRAAVEEILERRPELRRYFEQHVADLATRNFLRLCSSFRALSPAEIQALLRQLETREFPAGTTVFQQGDPGDRFYLIRSGRARVVRNGQSVTTLGEGQFFGELALLTGDPRAASVIAETDLSTLTLSAAAFSRLLEEDPELRESIEAIAYSYQSVPVELRGKPEERAPQPAPPEVELEPTAPGVEEVRPRRRWPVVRQIGERDCGAACLSMIGKYYGRSFRVPTLRDMAGTTREGASLRSLADTAERLGFRARPVRTSLAHLSRTTLPLIAHWGGNHFVVVYESRRGRVVVGDPALGLRRMTEEEFARGWTGFALLLEPSAELAPSEDSPSLLRRFVPVVRPYWPLLAEVLVCSLLLQVLGLAPPLFTQVILDRVVVHHDVPMLNLMLGGMVVVVVFQLLTSILRQYLLVYAVRRIDVSMSVQFLSHVLRLPTRYFEDTRVGDIVARFAETEHVRELLTGTATMAILDALTIAVYTFVLLAYNAVLTLILLVTVPFFALLSLLITPLLRTNFRASFEAYSEAQSHLVETVSGVQVVKSACAERPVRWKWEELLLKHIRLQFQTMNFRLLLESLGTVMQMTVTTALLWYGARLVIADRLSVGQLMAFMALSGTLMGSMLRIVRVWDTVEGARLSLERLADVLDTKPEEPLGAVPLPYLPRVEGHLRFEKVTFRYSEQARANALENIDLEVLPGQTVALVGRSGCGKSTLIKLLMRLYEPTSGHIKVDGQDLDRVDIDSWRRQVGLVAQESFLFSGTIRENIALGYPDAAFEEVQKAAVLAGAHEFISELPLGYNTMVGERGASLSGGQRQRINLARALLHDPRVLILDEATSALDTESERAIQRNLEGVLRGRTILVIAHRLSTVRHADRIVVMDRGVVVEQGTHEELMGRRGLYFYLCSQQLDQ